MPADRRGGWGDLDTGTIIVAEFISAVLTWGGIGWLLDRWLHTKPWLVAIGLVIGTAAGFFLMYLRSQGMISTASQPQGARGNPSTDEGPAPVEGASTTEHTTEGTPHGSS